MGERGFLRRWARRKAEARQGKPKAPVEPVPAAEPAAAGAEEEAAAAARPPVELPDPETLGPDSDYRPFMARNVPAELRRRALRKLWRSDPVLANLDGLIDYAEDYTDAANVVPDLRTAYRVGRGLLDALPEPEATPDDAGPKVAAVTPEDAAHTVPAAPSGGKPGS